MEVPTNNRRVGIIAPIFIVILSLIANIPMAYLSRIYVGYISADLVNEINNILHLHREFLVSIRLISMMYLINIFIVVAIELAIVAIFHMKINRLFKMNNFITIKKFIKLAIIIIFIQLIITVILWNL
jgi:hypothetical protein